MANTNKDLGSRIEQMIAEHIAATRKAAQEAVSRAFSEASPAARLRVAAMELKLLARVSANGLAGHGGAYVVLSVQATALGRRRRRRDHLRLLTELVGLEPR